MSKAHPDKQVPEYGRKIRELRKTSGLTQRRFAAELRTTNITISRWEGGTREPNLENYSALAAFAKNKASPLAEFFAQRIQAGKAESKEKGRRTQALRELEMEEYFAAGGDEESQRLLEFVRLDPVSYARQWNQRAQEARKTLDNGAFAVKLDALTYEAAKVNALHRARGLRIKRAFELLRRQAEVESVRQGNVKTILAEAKAASDQGRPVDLVRLVDKVVSVISLRRPGAKRRGAREGIEVGGINLKPVDQIFERIVIAEGKGKSLDGARVLRDLEQAFGLKKERR